MRSIERLANFLSQREVQSKPASTEEYGESKVKQCSRRDFLRFCLGSAALLTIEPILNKLEAAGIGRGGSEKEKYKNGINYLSEESAEFLSKYERFYPQLRSAETPIVIGTLEDLKDLLPPGYETLYEKQGVGAITFTIQGKDGKHDRLIYIMYFKDIKELDQADQIRVPIHEGWHATHYSEAIKQGKEPGKLLMRYPELSAECNEILEELITNNSTIDGLSAALEEPQKYNLNETEISSLNEAIRKEKIYARENYGKYYLKRYGSRFETPGGEREMKDKVDQYLEFIWKKHKLREIKYEDVY